MAAATPQGVVPEGGRKSPGLKGVGARATADIGLILQPNGAFETYPDFAKMNARCYKTARANTFNTPPPLVGTTSPSPSSRPDSRQARAPTSASAQAPVPPPGPIRDLLEIFEMGVAKNMTNFKNELREEVHQATESMRKEVLAALADTRGLVMLAEINQKVDKLNAGPVNVDFSAVLGELRNHELIQREAMQALDRQVLQQTSQVFDELHAMQSRQRATEDHREAQIKALQAAHDSERAALDALHSAQQACRSAIEALGEDSGRAEQETRQRHKWVELAHRGAAERDREVADMVLAAQAQLGRLEEAQRALAARCEQTAADVLALRQEGEEYKTGLMPELARQLQVWAENVDFGQVLTQIWNLHNTMNMEFPHILQEIGRVQEALNVDFVQLTDLRTQNQVCAVCQKLVDGSIVPVPKPPPMAAPGHQGADVLMLRDSGSLAAVPVDAVALKVQAAPSVEDPLARQQQLMAKMAGMMFGGRRAGESEAAKRRVRHYWSQTEELEQVHGWAQTDEVYEKPAAEKKKARRKSGFQKPLLALEEPQRKLARSHTKPHMKRVFADSEQMKQRARQALIRPQFVITDYYHKTGIAQKIAGSPAFDNLTLAVIFVNTIWLAIDADYNQAVVLVDAKPIFIVVENLFCLYFTFEICVRFAAFRRKRDCIKDWWLIFDVILAILMIIETWVITLVVLAAGVGHSASLSSFSVLRAARIVKMVRISRMARLLRSLPELVILFKGIKAASRSVLIFFLLWLIIIYVYALVFRMMSDDDSPYFDSVPLAMNTLLLEGVLPAHAAIVGAVTRENAVFWPIMLSFIALASVTLMNMLVGVLVEVVSAIASTEKESIAVLALASDLRDAMNSIGRNPEEPIAKQEFPNLISEPEVAHVVQKEGVDVVSLVDMTDSIFDERAQEGDPSSARLTFPDLVELVLNMRGTNPAKVKDVKQQLRVMKALVRDAFQLISENLTEEIRGVRDDLEKVQATILARAQEEESSNSGGEDSSPGDAFTFALQSMR